MRPLTPLLLAIAGGITAALSHPPVAAWPLVFVGPLLLLLALDRHAVAGGGPRGAAVLGWLAGLAGFAPMLSWLIAPAGTIGWLLLSGVQALFPAALALLLWPLVAGGPAWRRWLPALAPVLWTGVESWRGRVPLGGFGWGNPMYAHADGSWMLPMARLLGGHALTLFTVAVATLLYDAVRRVRDDAALDATGRSAVGDRLQAGLPRAQRSFLALTGVLLLSVVLTIEPPPVTGETLDVLAVQGNDRERPGDDPRREDQLIADSMLRLTTVAVAEDGPPQLTVWPESSVDRDPFTAAGADLAPIVEQAAAVVGGGLTVGSRLDGPRPGTFYNATVLVDSSGAPVDRYVKRQLVPFGEFVPWRDVLGDVPPLRQVSSDGIPGGAPTHLRVGGAVVAPAICFETLFPELIRENVLGPDGTPAGLVVMSTNDASFGRSAESAQHLAQSRLRAVETGRWVVHAALSGGSAFIDPDGGVHDRTGLFEATSIRARLPLVAGTTPFLATGDLVGTASRWAVLGWLGALVVARARGTGSRSHRDGGS